MAEDIRIAIAGTGGMARTMAAAIGGVAGLTIAGFVSRDPARAEATARDCGGRGYAALDEALAEADALYVATDNAGHAAASIAALAAGRPVLCEKPCALDAAEAQAIADAAARSGTLFMEAVATPFLPAIARALAAPLGRRTHLAASFGYPADAASHPGLFAAQGGGVLLDRAVYLVTLARLALGPVERVVAEVRRDGAGIDVAATLLLTHAGGATASLACSLEAPLANDMVLSGTGGTASVPAPLLSAERVAITPAAAPARAAPATGMKARIKASGLARRMAALRPAPAAHHGYGTSLYEPELVHFRDLVRAGAAESPLLPPSLSVEVMRVLDAARAAG